MRSFAWILIIIFVVVSVIGTIEVKKTYQKYALLQESVMLLQKQKERSDLEVARLKKVNSELDVHIEKLQRSIEKIINEQNEYAKGAQSLYE